MKQAKIYIYNNFAGILTEDENGYKFEYDSAYLLNEYAEPISLTLPLSKESYLSNILHPFFDGLIPEGWLLEIARESWKLSNNDRFGLLLTVCKDCIGDVRIENEVNR